MPAGQRGGEIAPAGESPGWTAASDLLDLNRLLSFVPPGNMSGATPFASVPTTDTP